MPNVEEDLIEGLSISEDAGLLKASRTFFCTDLAVTVAEGDPPATPVQILASALLLTSAEAAPVHTGADVPGEYDSIVLNGKTLYVASRTLEPCPPTDAIVRVSYSMNPRNLSEAGFSPTTWETGSTAEQAETNFDYANLQLAFAARTPITVTYTPPGGAGISQSVKVPILRGKASFSATREETSNPEARALAYVCMTNSAVWRGHAIDTVLCYSIVGRNPGNTGKWVTCYQFITDPVGKFKQLAEYVDSQTGKRPKLLTSDLAGNNGLHEVTVQGSADFNALGF